MKKKILKVRSFFYKSICGFQTSFEHVKNCKINGFTLFNGREEFGTNVNFNGCKVMGRGVVKFGDNFHSASGLKILTSIHNYNGNRIPYDYTIITKDVVIKDNVWIGMDVKILGGVTIEEGAIIQAGSVIVSNIPRCAIAGGHPAKVFASRDEEKYDRLKEEKMFL